jgi:dTDP-4-dehydrorhamnose 3,5-epimerase
VFKFKKTTIHDCYEIYPEIFKDKRGKFIKIFNKLGFQKLKLNLIFTESYYTVTKPNVVRGFHFQTPPYDHAKLIYCTNGEVMDVILDVRLGSSTYGKYFSIKLSEKKANMIYIGRGLAHGFATYKKTSTLVYNLTSVYNARHDKGILWSSVGVKWPHSRPIISKRDQSFTKFKDFVSPFKSNT